MKRAHFEPDLSHLGPSSVPKALEVAHFVTKMCPEWVKNVFFLGQKCVFPKMIVDHFACSNGILASILSPFGLNYI